MTDITQTNAVRTVAPEDISVRDYVVVLRCVYEVPSYHCDDSQPIRVRRVELNACDEPSIDRVVAVFLPFVAVRNAHGEHAVLDVRRQRLARVPCDIARALRQAIREDKRRADARDSDA